MKNTFLINLNKFVIFLALLIANNVIAQLDIAFNNSKLVPLADSSNQSNTGVNTSTIPIHVFKGREMDLPINLSYSASGIKVNEIANNVGLGWNLNVGGKISRVVRGNVDHYNAMATVVPNCFKGVASSDHVDTNRDYYVTNVNGFNDVFVFYDENFIMTSSMNNPNVIISTNNIPYATNGGFIVTNEDGTQYFFGQNEVLEQINTLSNYKNLSTNYNGYFQMEECNNINYIYTTSWMLTKIVSKNGLDVYDFTYQSYDWLSYINNSGDGFTYTKWEEDFPNNTNSTNYKLRYQMLTEIKHNSKKIVSFDYGPRSDLNFVGGSSVGNALNAINFYNYESSSLFKKTDFIYSYFGDINPQSPYLNKRLKLDSIIVKGVKDGIEYNGDQYIFGYIDPQNVPPINSYAQDYIGLYNAKNTNANLIPLGDSRNYNFEASLAGTLNKITYPDKGYTVFEYEQNALNGGYGTIYVPPITHEGITSTIDLANIVNDNDCYQLPIQFTGKHNLMTNIVPNNFANSPYNQSPYENFYSHPIGNAKVELIDLSNETSNTLCNIVTSGDGIYTIQKLDDCDSPSVTILNCEEEMDLFDGCLIDTRTIYFDGISSSHNFILAGLTESANPQIITKSLSPGKYQITVWNIAYYDVNITPPIVTVYKNIYGTIISTPGYYQNTDLVSEIVDGFRIKKVINYSNSNKICDKKLYRYNLGKIESVVNQHDKYFPFVGEVHFQTSRGYLNSNFIHYRQVFEINLNEDDTNNGYNIYTFRDNSNYPFEYPTNCGLSNPDPAYAGIFAKFPLLKKSIYNKNYKLVCSEEFIYDYLPFALFEKYSNTFLSINGFVFLKERKSKFYTSDSETSNIQQSKSIQYEATGSCFVPFQSFSNNEVEYYDYEDYNYSHFNIQNQSSYVQILRVSKIQNNVKGDKKFIYTPYINDALPTPTTHYLVTEIQSSKPNEPLEPKTRFEYDTDGNMVSTVQVTPGTIANKQWDSLIYGYDNRFVIAKLTGIKYSDIPSSLINNIKAASNQAITPASIAALETALNALRNSTDVNVQNSHITTYTYNPVYGVTSVIDPKGFAIYTEYDAFGRVKLTKEKTADGSLKILSENQYNTRSY